VTGGSILQVEDEKNDVFFLRHAFGKAGIANHLALATDGAIAIEFLAGTGAFADREKYPFPCIVLLDLKLPRVSGFEVLRWIRRQPAFKALVVIVFTSSTSESDVREAYDLGANSVVLKPGDVPEQIAMAQQLKGWWLELNRFGHCCSGERPGGEAERNQ
jgi:CheY-like chemotaxis protein